MLRHAQQFGTGRLSIGFVGNVAYGLVPRLLSAFRKSHSGIHLEIAEMLTRDQIRALGTGQLDAGIVRLPIRNATGLQSRVIDRDRFVLALPKDHRRTRRKAVRLGDLRDEPFVAYSQERVPVLHSASVALCLKEGFYPDIVCQAWQASSILSFVAAGVGLALIPSHLAVFRHDAVAYRPLLISPENDFALDIALIWRDGDVSPPLAAFIATVSAPRVRERSVVP
ncbi:MAG: LysR family substrate-binding domain-containing protein [Lautropia sp.]